MKANQNFLCILFDFLIINSYEFNVFINFYTQFDFFYLSKFRPIYIYENINISTYCLTQLLIKLVLCKNLFRNFHYIYFRVEYLGTLLKNVNCI